MKKRNLTALGLALAMTLGLASPALAAEEKEPALSAASAVDDDGAADVSLYLEDFVWQYMEEHPEHYEAFDTDAYFAQEYGDWYTKEEYMEDWGLETEEDFKQDMWQECLNYPYSMDEALYEAVNDAHHAYLLEIYESRHPGELDGLNTEDLLARLGYTETLTPAEQFMKEWDLDNPEKVRPVLLAYYAMDRLRMEQIHADFLSYQAEYPEEWADFDADAYFEEYDWYGYADKKEYMDYWNIFTEEEFTETMFVDYVESNYWTWDDGWDDGDDWDDDWYYPWYDDEERPLTLVVNGQQMEEADITAENGWSYLSVSTLNAILGTHNVDDGERKPLRETLEAEGWDVGWNRQSNTVYILDRETILAGLEEDMAALTALTDWAAEYGPERTAGQSYQTTGTCSMTITAFNSLDGDETYDLDVKVETLARDNVVNMTLTVDAADLLRLLGEDLTRALAAEMPKVTFQNLKTLLTGVKLDLIWNGDEEVIYLNFPLLAAFDATISEDTWYKLDLSGGEEPAGDDLAAALAGEIYETLLDRSGRNYYTPEEAYETFEEQRKLVAGFLGEDRLERKSGALTWSVDAQAVNALVSELTGETVTAFKTFEISCTAKTDGSVVCDLNIRPDMEGLTSALYSMDPYYSYYYLLSGRLMSLFDFQLTAHSEESGDVATGTMEYHQKNAFKLNLELESRQKAVKEAPEAAPAEGATIVEA